MKSPSMTQTSSRSLSNKGENAVSQLFPPLLCNTCPYISLYLHQAASSSNSAEPATPIMPYSLCLLKSLTTSFPHPFLNGSMSSCRNTTISLSTAGLDSMLPYSSLSPIAPSLRIYITFAGVPHVSFKLSMNSLFSSPSFREDTMTVISLFLDIIYLFHYI